MTEIYPIGLNDPVNSGLIGIIRRASPQLEPPQQQRSRLHPERREQPWVQALKDVGGHSVRDHARNGGTSDTVGRNEIHVQPDIHRGACYVP